MMERLRDRQSTKLARSALIFFGVVAGYSLFDRSSSENEEYQRTHIVLVPSGERGYDFLGIRNYEPVIINRKKDILEANMDN